LILLQYQWKNLLWLVVYRMQMMQSRNS